QASITSVALTIATLMALRRSVIVMSSFETGTERRSWAAVAHGQSVTQQAQALNDGLELHSIGSLHIQVDDRLRAMRCNRQAAAAAAVLPAGPRVDSVVRSVQRWITEGHLGEELAVS